MFFWRLWMMVWPDWAGGEGELSEWRGLLPGRPAPANYWPTEDSQSNGQERSDKPNYEYAKIMISWYPQ